MLSIIISSYQPEYFTKVEKNIAETCGIQYEIVKIENPKLMGICEAYNRGAEKAQYENLLFLHEDVEFVTQNWGGLLIESVNKISCGILGLAGSDYVPNVPFCWWDNFENTVRNIYQFADDKAIRDYNITSDKQVFAIDGVFIACKKKIWEEFRFNNLIKGFHGYDLDFSIRVSEKYSNIVAHNIKLKHFSVGNPNKDWFENILVNRRNFSTPSRQILHKKTELFFYRKLEERLKLFNIQNYKRILLKYNNPSYIGFKAALKNTFNLIFND